MRQLPFPTVLSTFALASLALAACSGEDISQIDASTPGAAAAPGPSADPSAAPSTPETPGSAGSAGSPDAEPRYVVFSTVDNPEGRNGYFVTTPSLARDATIDISRGIEEPGGGRLYVEPGIGNFMIGGGEEPTITRYELGADGALIRGATLSFANQGADNLRDQAIVFVSASRAYLRDRAQLQLIEFDPTAMEIRGSVQLEGVTREGYRGDFGAALQRDDGIWFPMFWSDPDDPSRAPEGATLVHVDAESGQVEVSQDPRCSGLYAGLLAENGDAYWFSSEIRTFAWRSNPASSAGRDCALRVRRGETRFDPDWELDVTALTNGWPAIATVPGQGSSMWLRVLDESLAPVPAGADPGVLRGLGGWQWYRLDVTSGSPAVRNDDRAPAGYYAYGFVVDGHTYTTESSADYSQATLLELGEQGFVEGATVAGTVRGLARLR